MAHFEGFVSASDRNIQRTSYSHSTLVPNSKLLVILNMLFFCHPLIVF